MAGMPMLAIAPAPALAVGCAAPEVERHQLVLLQGDRRHAGDSRRHCTLRSTRIHRTRGRHRRAAWKINRQIAEN